MLGQHCWDMLRWDVAVVWLSPGQTIATFQLNISQHCWVQHVVCVWPPCCDMLRHVGWCWLKYENGQIFHATFVDAAWCCSLLASFVQQCCTWACAIVRFSTRNMSQHVATEWPNAYNMLPSIMLRSVRSDRLAGTLSLKQDMFRSFNDHLQMWIR